MPDNQISKKVNFDSIATFDQVSAIDDLGIFSNGILGIKVGLLRNLVIWHVPISEKRNEDNLHNYYPVMLIADNGLPSNTTHTVWPGIFGAKCWKKRIEPAGSVGDFMVFSFLWRIECE